VIIVKDPDKGIVDDNLMSHKGDGVSCPHLRGNKAGEYSCGIHDRNWYDETPCYDYGQIEASPECHCRTGDFMMEQFRKTGKTWEIKKFKEV